MPSVLPLLFYARPVLHVARDLLGKFLVRRVGTKEIAGMITEVEAYAGKRDMASHARIGLTKRNTAMFGPPGHFYVYFTYGMHHCVNIVTGREGEALAVLIRGVEGITGPGRVCKMFKIDLSHYAKSSARASGI